MSQKLRRPITPPNTQGNSTLLNRAARAPLQMMMTLAELLSGRTLAGASTTAGYLGDAFRVQAVEGTNQITIRRGLGWYRDAGGADDPDWSGEVRPIYAEADLTTTVGTNGAGSNREDGVFVRAIYEDLDVTSLNVKDTLTGPIRVENHALTREYKLEVQVTQGVAGGAPGVAPAGDGWLRIASVIREPSVVNVTQANIFDRRGASSMQGLLTSNELQAAGNLFIGLFKIAADKGYQLFTLQEAGAGDLAAGDMIITDRAWDDVDPSGKIRLGELVAHVIATTDKIRARTAAGYVYVRNAADSARGIIRARNTAYQAANFSHPGGTPTPPYTYTINSQTGGVLEIEYQGGTEKQIFVSLSEALPSANGVAIAFPAISNTTTAVGHFAGVVFDTNTVILQYFDAAGALAEPPNLNGGGFGRYQLIVFDPTA